MINKEKKKTYNKNYIKINKDKLKIIIGNIEKSTEMN